MMIKSHAALTSHCPMHFTYVNVSVPTRPYEVGTHYDSHFTGEHTEAHWPRERGREGSGGPRCGRTASLSPPHPRGLLTLEFNEYHHLHPGT